MMETSQRGKRKGAKKTLDKFTEINNMKNMKEKMKNDKKLSSMAGGDILIKNEVGNEHDFKKEPGLNHPVCENENKMSCNKPNDNKSLKSGLIDSSNLVKDNRNFIEHKPDIGLLQNKLDENQDENEFPSAKIKTENTSDSNLFPQDPNENLILGLVNHSGSLPGNTLEHSPAQPQQQQQQSQQQPPQSGVQPLPSNVINKQPGTMEAQYMQQQSQIFVFSTALANKSAESVIQGQHPSIIAYHCAQPGTKKYLEKHPLKLNQFNRQSPAQWLNSLAQMKQKTMNSGSMLKGMSPMPPGPGPRGMGNMPGPCDMTGPRPMGPNPMTGPMPDLDNIRDHSGELNTAPCGPGGPNPGMDPRSNEFMGGPMNPVGMWNQGQMNNMACSIKNMDMAKAHMIESMNSSFPGVSQLTLTGTKVPTENLTPQQRQHREEQLATLRKMQMMLFPENQTQPTDEFGNVRVPPPNNPNICPGSDPMMDPNNPLNRNGCIDNDLKNGMGGKRPNNNNMAANNTNSNNSNNNDNHSSNVDNSENRNNEGSKNNEENSNIEHDNNENTVNNNHLENNDEGNNDNNNNSNNINDNNDNNNNNNTHYNNSNSNHHHSSHNTDSNNHSTSDSHSHHPNSNSADSHPNSNYLNRSLQQSNGGMPMEGRSMTSQLTRMDTDSMESLSDLNPMKMQKLAGGGNFSSVAAQLEWQKLQYQFIEERKKKVCRTDSPVPRNCGTKMQGPPPPYHQTARSASVPVPSPSAGSPTNTTSNLSLPSPRTSCDLNSPSELNKLSKVNSCSPSNNHGSPSCSKMTSDSCISASQSPTASLRKDTSQSTLEFSMKDMFSRSMPPQKHQKQMNSNKEPNLMPVPSPQQIQYLNTFEGQELTIQKQPNTSLKESNITSPLNHAPLVDTPKSKTPNGATNSPHQVPETSPRFGKLSTPCNTPTTPVSSQSQTSIPLSKDTTSVPTSPSDPTGLSHCRADNLPLNPNGMTGPPTSKSLHFDPITSLAQMSQQLTSPANPPPCSAPNTMMSFNTSSMHLMDNHMGPDNPPMVNMHQPNMDNMSFVPNNQLMSCPGPMMDMPGNFMNSSSPKPNMGNPPNRCVAPFYGNQGGFQRMMVPNSYNGMNIQVKASTPNTIQYLPARPTNPPTRGPPSLDFLQRFSNPMNHMDSKGPASMFMSNCHNNPMDGGPNVNNMNCGGPPGGMMMNNQGSPVPPSMLLGGNMVMNPNVNPVRGQMRPTGPNVGGLMKGPGPGPGPGFPPGPGCDPMGMGPGPNNLGNPNMFIQGSKSSPLGLPPDASQPLPPSMSQGNNFKSSPFIGPNVSDPNYAQQFHNFQQQLYATNTRSQLNTHLNQPYFVPK